jgi:hypothetical protein
MTAVIDTIFKEWNTLWDLHNGDRHGRDTKTKMQADEQQAIRECTQLYEKHKDTVTADLQYHACLCPPANSLHPEYVSVCSGFHCLVVATLQVVAFLELPSGAERN